jgi:hypothetical protein
MLLHAGTPTLDIFHMYIRAIECFKLLDPLESMLHMVTTPIWSYLRTRKDTVRHMLTQVLLDEKYRNQLSTVKEVDYVNWNKAMQWQPESYGSQARNLSLIQKLLSNFENKAAFQREFEALLSERLLNAHDYNVTLEAQIYDVLQSYLGADHLATSHIMLQDVDQSQQTDAAIHVSTAVGMPLHAVIMTRPSWPHVQAHTLEPSPHVKTYHNALCHDDG